MKIDVEVVFPLSRDYGHFSQKHYFKCVQDGPNRSELMCSGRVHSSCSTSGTRRVNIVTNSVISHE